jgi:hypothetical protein
LSNVESGLGAFIRSRQAFTFENATRQPARPTSIVWAIAAGIIPQVPGQKCNLHLRLQVTAFENRLVTLLNPTCRSLDVCFFLRLLGAKSVPARALPTSQVKVMPEESQEFSLEFSQPHKKHLAYSLSLTETRV